MTPVKRFPPDEGSGLATVVQLLPFQASTSVDDGLPLAPMLAPTAQHWVAVEQVTLLR